MLPVLKLLLLLLDAEAGTLPVIMVEGEISIMSFVVILRFPFVCFCYLCFLFSYPFVLFVCSCFQQLALLFGQWLQQRGSLK